VRVGERQQDQRRQGDDKNRGDQPESEARQKSFHALPLNASRKPGASRLGDRLGGFAAGRTHDRMLRRAPKVCGRRS
jgi:hypothetical protein